MSELAVIIFSKDRPLQLDATIRSLRSNCDDIGAADLRVLYVASAPAYAAGYHVLANEHPGVRLHPESDFKADLVQLVESTSHVLFLVDDTLFVGPMSLARTIQVLDEDGACLGFSFRLGRNTTYCYTLDRQQRLPAFEELRSGLLTFNWTDAEHDFGYPLEVSSSLYRTSDVLPLLRELEYRNPNTLESVLAQHADSFRETCPRLACYARSVGFSVPANLVQTTWQNRIDGDPALTVEALAGAYAHGQRLDVERYRGFVANACHQELEFSFTRRSDVPTVSVVIPCYGQAEYLPEAVASVVGQTFTDWELVIVDDGSPDDTAAVAESLIEHHPDRRIRLLRQQNGGVARARNAGIAVSKGRYILPLDADDAIAPEMLARTVGLLETDQATSIAYTDWQCFGASEHRASMQEFNAFTLPARDQFAYSALFRREVWESVGGYRPTMVLGYEDWDFWIGCVESGWTARRVPEPLFCYRLRPGTRQETALRHDKELKRQIRANHPRLYRPWLRAIRFALLALRALRTQVWRAVARSPVGPPLRSVRDLWRRLSRGGDTL